MRRQCITVSAQTLVQGYTYDEVNRLQSAHEASGQTETWRQEYRYTNADGQHGQYGNRRLFVAQTPWLVTEHPEFNPTNNRIAPQAGEQYAYDAVGNLTRDKDGDAFAYDGENRQTLYKGGASVNGGATYSYDGDGRRVKKVAGVVSTVFVYDAMGQLVAEYSSEAPTENGTQYLTADNLGSPRVVTGADGAVKARHDYLPFGEEIGADVGGRTGQGYSQVDGVRQGFTGYEKDGETGLNFAQNRYHSPIQGRFTSVDPVSITVSKLYDPQEINPYAYCRNNPLSYTDHSGAILDPSKWDKKSRDAFNKYEAELKSDPSKYKDELATLQQLRKSDVNYVVRLGANSNFGRGDEGGLSPDPNNQTIFINLANEGNRSEKFSLFSRFGHEFEHARQFDSGEFGFAWDANNKYLGRAYGDISEEVKAWRVQSRLSNAEDRLVKYGSQDTARSILGDIDSRSDMDAAKVLANVGDTYNESYKGTIRGGTFGKNFTVPGVPPGTLLTPSSKLSGSNRYFGRTN